AAVEQKIGRRERQRFARELARLLRRHVGRRRRAAAALLVGRPVDAEHRLLLLQQLDHRIHPLALLGATEAGRERNGSESGEQDGCCAHARHYIHSPLRITGSVAPPGSTPSTSSSDDPIMKSTCAALRLAPTPSNSSSLIASPPR